MALLSYYFRSKKGLFGADQPQGTPPQHAEQSDGQAEPQTPRDHATAHEITPAPESAGASRRRWDAVDGGGSR